MKDSDGGPDHPLLRPAHPAGSRAAGRARLLAGGDHLSGGQGDRAQLGRRAPDPAPTHLRGANGAGGSEGDRMAVATKHALVLLANDEPRLAPSYPAAARIPTTRSSCRAPSINCRGARGARHGLDREGLARRVNTLFSCLFQLDPHFSFRPVWKPPFVTALAPEDRCHLNGLALVDGPAALRHGARRHGHGRRLARAQGAGRRAPRRAERRGDPREPRHAALAARSTTAPSTRCSPRRAMLIAVDVGARPVRGGAHGSKASPAGSRATATTSSSAPARSASSTPSATWASPESQDAFCGDQRCSTCPRAPSWPTSATCAPARRSMTCRCCPA